MKIIIALTILLVIYGCDFNKKNEINEFKEKKIDTLYYTTNINVDSEGFAIPYKECTYISKKGNGLPKNEEIILTLKYTGEYKKLIRHSIVELYPCSKSLKIKKIDDFKFRLFIDSSYSSDLISMSYYIGPKKNYVMKFSFQEDIINYPYKIKVSTMNRTVRK